MRNILWTPSPPPPMFDVLAINPNNMCPSGGHIKNTSYSDPVLFIPPAQLKESSDENYYRRTSIEVNITLLWISGRPRVLILY